MPRINITYAQLDLDMLDDDRWLYRCTESQQLLYIKLILLAGRLKNRIPMDYRFLHSRLNYQDTAEQLRADLNSILAIYPGVIMKPNYIYFKKFWKRYSYVRKSLRGDDKDCLSSAQGLPKSDLRQQKGNANIIEGNISKEKLIKENTTRLFFLINLQKQSCPADSESKIRAEFESAVKSGIKENKIEQIISTNLGRHCWDIINLIRKGSDTKSFVPQLPVFKPCRLCGITKSEKEKCSACQDDPKKAKEIKQIKKEATK